MEMMRSHYSLSSFPAKTTSVNYNWLPRKLNYSVRELRNFGGIRASSTAAAQVRWLLQPIGDGDTKHIGYKIAMPAAFGNSFCKYLQITINLIAFRNDDDGTGRVDMIQKVVTVGRVREKADVVIPVPTVSALHARIQKTEENLLVTDLDSTNGTFVNEKRLIPGVVFPASPGNLIVFGDTNLAIFRVYKLDKEEITTEPEEPGVDSAS